MKNNNKNLIYRILIVFFAISTLFLNVILVNNLPVFQIDFILFSMLIFIISSVIGIIINYSNKYLSTLFLTIILFSYIDIAAGGHKIIAEIAGYSNEWPAFFYFLNRAMLLLIFFLIIFYILRKLKSNAEIILLAFFASAMIGNITNYSYKDNVIDPRSNKLISDNSGQIPDSRKDKNNLFIHIILDEMMSPAAFPENIDGSESLKNEIKSFFKKYNFTEYVNTYSRHAITGHSIRDLLNFKYKYTETERSSKYFVGRATKNKDIYFKEMSKVGYKVVVFQTKHVEFCKNSYVVECYTLDSFNPVSKFIISDKNRLTRFKEYSYTIIKPFFSPTSKITRNSYILNYFFYLFHSYFDDVPMWVDGYAFPKWFDYINDKISEYPDNTMVFVHLLVPHAPYILDYDCKYSGKPDYPYSLGEDYNFQNREKILTKREEQYKRYFAQTGCVFKKLEELLHMLDTQNKLENTIIILQGDHGSRISNDHLNIENMNKRDLIDNFATMFSIKSNSLAPGLDQRFISIHDAFAEFIGTITNNDIKVDETNFVISRKADKKFTKTKMPEFGK